MGELNIESIKNAALKKLAEQADAKTNGEEKSGNGKIDSVFEESVLRSKIRDGLTNLTLSEDDELKTIMESIGLELTKDDKKARESKIKAHEQEIKAQAAQLVKDLTDASKSQDDKYIKKQNAKALKEKLDNGEISQELYDAAIEENKKTRTIWQLFRGERTAQSTRRHAVAAKNKVNFRAYEADEDGNRHTVVERLEARLATESKEYVEDGTEKKYTEEQLLNGFKYTDPESGKTIKFKAISKKVLDDLVISGKYIRHEDGTYTIAKASEDLRLEVGSDYTANWSKKAADSELANIAGEMGLSRKGILGTKNNNAARAVSKQTGYETDTPLDAGRVAAETLKGAGIGALGAMAQEKLRPKQVIDASTDLRFNNTVNIDFGSQEYAQQFVDRYSGSAKVKALGNGIIQVVTNIAIFDPKIFELTKDILGAAAKGAIAGAIAGFAMGVLNGKKSEESALPEINCTKYPTIQKLQAHLDGMVRNGDVKPEPARIAMMIAAANSDGKGNIDCDSFNIEIALQKGNNIWSKPEVECYGIDTPKTKPNEPKEKEEIVVYTEGTDAQEEIPPKETKVNVPTTKGVLWDNLAAQYDCLPSDMSKSDKNRMMKVMQAVTNNNYNIANLQELVSKSRNVRVPKPLGKDSTWTPAQIAQVKASAKQAFAGVEGFDSDAYVDTLLAQVIGEQKTPQIILADGSTCERNPNIKGTAKVRKGGVGPRSGHTDDTILTVGRAAKAGSGKMTVAKNGTIIEQRDFGSKSQADAAADAYVKDHKNVRRVTKQ